MLRKKQVSRAAAAALSVCLLLAACGSGSGTAWKPSSASSKADADWTVADGETIQLKNSRVLLQMDTGTAHFSITDLQSGKAYTSVPEEDDDSISEDYQKRMASEITIRYYDKNSVANYMYSTADGVKNGGLKVKYNDSTIRVYYTFGTENLDLFVPQVLVPDMYNKMVNTLSESDMFRLQLYYHLYSARNQDDDYKAMLKKYPQLAKTDLYILDPTVSSLQKEDIDGYMKQAGITAPSYEAILKKLGIQEEKDTHPGFLIPVEYTLTDDGFQARVLTDKIQEQSDAYKLQQIDLLQYLGATGSRAKGYYLVPDGSGAIIDMNTTRTGTYSQPFYGSDPSISESSATQLDVPAMLPVFGVHETDGGLFAMVEGAAAAATLNVQTKSSSSPMNTAYISFAYRTKDSVSGDNADDSSATDSTAYNIYSAAPLSELPCVQYAVLKADESDYARMAAYYRGYLVSQGYLKKERQTPKSEVMLDYMCEMTVGRTFLGIPYQEHRVLSTLPEIRSALQKLTDAGFSNIVVRLNGYGSQGMLHGVYNSFRLDKRVGTTEQLSEIAGFLKRHGGQLFLDADFQKVYTDSMFDGFSQRSDTAYRLDRTLVKTGDYDIVTREYTEKDMVAFFVSPIRYPAIVSSFWDKLRSASNLSGNMNVSYGSAGEMLGGDYRTALDLNRVSALKLVVKALASGGGSKRYMLDGGNAYVLPYASYLADFPVNCSSFDIESRSVPFYPMVVHGYIAYSGGAYNQAKDPQTMFLRSIEYGASLQYLWTTRDDVLLRDTQEEPMVYSACQNDWMQILLAQGKKLKEYYDKVQGAIMTDDEQLTDQVFCTTYDNHVRVVVNYGDTPVRIDSVLVGAHDFHIFM